MTYTIKYTDKTEINLNDAEWSKSEVALVDKVNWNEFPVKPDVEARLLHNNDGIFVKFSCGEIPEVYCHETNGTVCMDSCVEFFFQPVAGDGRYLNLEINADKIIHLGVGKDRYDRTNPEFSYEDFKTENEKSADSWQIKYFIPFKYIEKVIGKCEKNIKGNLYKCAEITKTPHFLTYSPVSTPAPDYHQSKFFCDFVLED